MILKRDAPHPPTLRATEQPRTVPDVIEVRRVIDRGHFWFELDLGGGQYARLDPETTVTVYDGAQGHGQRGLVARRLVSGFVLAEDCEVDGCNSPARDFFTTCSDHPMEDEPPRWKDTRNEHSHDLDGS